MTSTSAAVILVFGAGPGLGMSVAHRVAPLLATHEAEAIVNALAA